MPATDAPTIAAERVLLVRPLDADARAALQRLCATVGARIRRGAVTLGDGVTRPALLATRGGATLAALLIDHERQGDFTDAN